MVRSGDTAAARAGDLGSPTSAHGHMRPGGSFRRVVYWGCGLGLAAWGTLGWAAVYAGLLPPHPTDDWCAAFTFVFLWVPVAALVDNAGERRTWVQRWEEFIYVWLITSGLAQCLWEAPFVLIKTSLLEPIKSTETLQPDELWLWPFWMYGSGDTRYLWNHPESHATETLLAISGPFELLAAKWIRRGPSSAHYKRGLIVAALLQWGFFWANTSVIYIAEIYANYKSIADGWAGFWLKWGGLNLQWSVLSPICTLAALYLLQLKCFEEGRLAAAKRD